MNVDLLYMLYLLEFWKNIYSKNEMLHLNKGNCFFDGCLAVEYMEYLVGKIQNNVKKHLIR